MHRAVDDVTRRINAEPRRVVDDISFGGDLDQIGGGDFVPQQTEGIDQKMMRLAGHARRDMRVDQVGHTEMCGQSVTSGKVDAPLPFFGTDAAMQGWHAQRIDDGIHCELLRLLRMIYGMKSRGRIINRPRARRKTDSAGRHRIDVKSALET